jgi:hypothetical protein
MEENVLGLQNTWKVSSFNPLCQAAIDPPFCGVDDSPSKSLPPLLGVQISPEDSPFRYDFLGLASSPVMPWEVEQYSPSSSVSPESVNGTAELPPSVLEVMNQFMNFDHLFSGP